jgi:capsular exopolysaccharide synthesis family protein
MSKNFELMQEAGMNAGVVALPEAKVRAWVFDRKEKALTKSGPLSVDKVMREESLKLVQSVFLSSKTGSPRVVVFAGIDSGSGCSGICAHTAETLARHKLGSVCMVDANLHAPSLPEFFGVTNHYGLTDALGGQGEIRSFSKQVRDEDLWLLSSGSLIADPSSLLTGDGMRNRVAELRKEFDYVLIDAPALATFADGIVLGQLADGVVLVLEANCTRRESASKIAESLRAAQIRILGAVLNKRTYPIPKLLYRML